MPSCVHRHVCIYMHVYVCIAILDRRQNVLAPTLPPSCLSGASAGNVFRCFVVMVTVFGAPFGWSASAVSQGGGSHTYPSYTVGGLSSLPIPVLAIAA